MYNEHSSTAQDVQAIKYYRCPQCHQSARLHVDIDTDSTPYLDDEGRRQYYCLRCLTTFSVGAPITPIRRNSNGAL